MLMRLTFFCGSTSTSLAVFVELESLPSELVTKKLFNRGGETSAGSFLDPRSYFDFTSPCFPRCRTIPVVSNLRVTLHQKGQDKNLRGHEMINGVEKRKSYAAQYLAITSFGLEPSEKQCSNNSKTTGKCQGASTKHRFFWFFIMS